MGMASGMDVRPCPVDGAVNHEPGGIDSSSVTADDLAILIDLHHVARREHAEMLSHAAVMSATRTVNAGVGGGGKPNLTG